jgi:hypothetical protein
MDRAFLHCIEDTPGPQVMHFCHTQKTVRPLQLPVACTGISLVSDEYPCKSVESASSVVHPALANGFY